MDGDQAPDEPKVHADVGFPGISRQRLGKQPGV
jgi:hypothetical protein